MKHFHSIYAGNTQECLVKLSIGRVRRDHGTGDKTTHGSAHRASKTPRHHRDQRFESPGKKFSPRARGKCAADPTELQYVTVQKSQIYFSLVYLIVAQISRIERFVIGRLEKRPDTVGQPPSTEIGVLNMPALKVKKLRKLPQEKVLLEL
jgi:hypothetical protein